MPTYLTHYQDFLEEKLQAGGAVAMMTECAREFNAVADPDYRPAELYRTWALNAPHICSTCGKRFNLGKDIVPSPGDETTCQTCTESRTNP